MKNRLLWIAAAAALLTLTGCAPKFESLSPDQKRDFYERVIEEAQNHRERALFYERIGYLQKALESYERAGFYGEIGGVDSARVAELEARIDTGRQGAYSRAKRALRQKKYKSALVEFNTVLKADSAFADAKAQRWRRSD